MDCILMKKISKEGMNYYDEKINSGFTTVCYDD